MPGTNRSHHKKLLPLSAAQQKELEAELAAKADAEVAAFEKKRVVESAPEPVAKTEPAPKPKPVVTYLEDVSFSAAKVRGRRVVITVED